MLLSLLRERLVPYRTYLTAVVVLQFVGVLAMLYLPSLNADIIDNGIVLGDTRYIIRTGGMMLAGSPAEFGRLLVQETEKWAEVVKSSGAKPD